MGIVEFETFSNTHLRKEGKKNLRKCKFS